MKKLLAALAALPVLVAGTALAQPGPVDLGTDPALAVAGRDIPATDARIGQARLWLKQIANASGESEEQVAAASIKLTRYFFDSLRLRILAIEALEGMAAQAASGKGLSDLTSGYFQARRAAPNKSHAEAMATLTAKK